MKQICLKTYLLNNENKLVIALKRLSLDNSYWCSKKDKSIRQKSNRYACLQSRILRCYCTISGLAALVEAETELPLIR